MAKKKDKRGRKPLKDNKERVVSMTICVKQRQIDAHGGIEKAREVAKEAFLNYTDVDWKAKWQPMVQMYRQGDKLH